MDQESNLKPLRRLRYYPGRLLTAEDLQAEQEYFRQRIKRNNLFLHGAGVVFGLSVTLENGKVRVSPGLAIDCSGEEIVVAQPAAFDLPAGDKISFLMLAYSEHAVESGPEGEAAFIEEGYQLSYETGDPYEIHGGDTVLSLPCGVSHPFPIAKLVKRLDGWAVDTWFQPATLE
jgi:hypothetical protein